MFVLNARVLVVGATIPDRVDVTVVKGAVATHAVAEDEDDDNGIRNGGDVVVVVSVVAVVTSLLTGNLVLIHA